MNSRMATIVFAVVLLSCAEAAVVKGRHVTVNVNGTHTNNAKAEPAAVVTPSKAASPKVVTKPSNAKPTEPAKAKATPAVVTPTKAKETKATPAVPAKAKAVPSKAKGVSLINPPLKDVSSDKKFFGPPFPADYPDDKRPVPEKSILDKVKGPDQPYPALQSKSEYDRDYVKDENNDAGHWKAQFEYDHLRHKLAKENGDANGAQGRADKEGHDVDDAQKNADAAGKGVDDAKKGLSDAEAEEANAGKGGDGAGAGDGSDIDSESAKDLAATKENLEKLKKAVAKAEADYEKEKKQFEECKRQLEEAKKNLEELKAKQAEMEAQLAAETKLWMETKTVRMNLKKTKEDAAHQKKVAAEARLAAAKAKKEEMDQILADKKDLHASSMKRVDEQKAVVAKAKADLEKAALTLQKLRGYKPAAPEPTKSGTVATSGVLSFAALLILHAL